MGGYGSGRRGGGAKATLNGAIRLDVRTLVASGRLGRAGSTRGSLRWTDAWTGEQTAVVGFVVAGGPAEPTLELNYVIDGDLVREPVHFAHTRPNYGGRRWWFRCPIRGCGRPCAALYLPLGGLLRVPCVLPAGLPEPTRDRLGPVPQAGPQAPATSQRVYWGVRRPETEGMHGRPSTGSPGNARPLSSTASWYRLPLG